LPDNVEELKAIITKMREKQARLRSRAKERIGELKSELTKRGTMEAEKSNGELDSLKAKVAELERENGEYKTSLESYKTAEEEERKKVLESIPEEDREGLEDLPLAKLKLIQSRFLSNRKRTPSPGQEKPVPRKEGGGEGAKPKSLRDAINQHYSK
jgi:hypothetical protein